MNEALKNIMIRKSVRIFTGAPVSETQLTELVKAGMAAPSAVDTRPWDFIIVTDKTLLRQLAKNLPYAKMTAQAAAAIVVTGDMRRQYGGENSLYWLMDCSAATENILLAAESMGLGAVWTAVFPEAERVAAVRKILGIPEHITPLNLIPFGVPEGKPQAKDKYNPIQVHKNHW
ncbi:MAG: nitroreductase family protein [Elusimicrobia bacterium]|nr:nitroreductase family protein [Elusimicrobiota bacterium]